MSEGAHPPGGQKKVSKFRHQIFLFSFEPKTEQNYFLNSRLLK